MSLALENVHYIYNEGTAYKKTALDGISLVIPQGQFVGLIGHTGCGKSTMIQLFNGLLKPSDGKVLYNGEDIWGDKYNRRTLRFHVGLVFQYPEHQLFENDLISDVSYGPVNKGLSKDEALKKAEEALLLTGIEKKDFYRSPFELSGGQKRRAAIAGVLAMEPDVLILDEPAAGLDPCGKKEILDTVKRLQKEKNITVILVSHSMDEIAGYVDRVIAMNNGKIAFDGTQKEVFGHTKELEEIGLCAPDVTYLMHMLKERGMNVDTDAFTLNDAAASILSYFGKKHSMSETLQEKR